MPVPMHRQLTTFALVLASCGAAQAATLNATPHANDTRVDSVGGFQDLGDGTNWAGELLASTPDMSVSSIFIFDLPAIPVGEAVTAATLTLRLTNPGPSGYNIDLYGLTRTASTTPVGAGDYFSGANDASNAKLADNFATSLTPVGNVTLSNAALVGFLNLRYAAFGPGHDFSGNDDFVFLRLSKDAANAIYGYNPYGFASANSATPPSLSITTGVVPEPASLAMLTLGGLAILARRR